MTDPLIQKHGHEIHRIARGYGAKRLHVFGSRARGTASATSDFDLLVDLEQGRDLLDLIGLKLDLEELPAVKVDVVTERALSPCLRNEILTSATAL